jgi:hypothetical protein
MKLVEQFKKINYKAASSNLRKSNPKQTNSQKENNTKSAFSLRAGVTSHATAP